MKHALGAASLGLVLMLAASSAHADRNTAILLGYEGGEMSTDGSDYLSYDNFGGFFLTASFENPGAAMPTTPGYAYGFALQPEVTVGILDHDNKGEGFLGVGVRAELQIVQREKGLLQVSGRSAIYLAGRAAIMGENQDQLYHFGVGIHASPGLSTRFRFGFEAGAVGLSGTYVSSSGAFATVFVGYAL